MLISNVPVYKIKAGMKVKDTETGQIGVISFVECEFGDVYSWVRWQDDSGRVSGFWGNHVDFELIEEN
jgi:hypothetical protein